MSQHGGAVDLIAMYDENDMEGAYIKAALGRLMVTCDFKDIATYESSVRRMEASHGKANPELNPLMLNQDLLELIRLDAREANERIGKKGFFRWQEENRKPGDMLMEGSNNLAYGLMMYHSAMVEMDALSKSAQQRDVRMPKKVTQEGKGVEEKGSSQNEAQIPRTGEEWHKYFNETYGNSNVTRESMSIQDIIDMPSRITDFTPQQIADLARANGWTVEPLGRGSKAGIPFEQGGGFSMHAPNGGSEYIQYHPGGGHHGADPYYKVSSGSNGTVRYNLNGGEVQ